MTPIATLTLVLLAVQVGLGALVATTDDVALYQGAHVVTASAVWAGVVALAVIALRPLAEGAGRIGDDSRVSAPRTAEGRPA